MARTFRRPDYLVKYYQDIGNLKRDKSFGFLKDEYFRATSKKNICRSAVKQNLRQILKNFEEID